MDRPDEATAEVFYWKLRADYNRYAAEAADDSQGRAAAVAESQAAYKHAARLGRRWLRPINPVRLGLMLNYSVFLYQICRQRRRGRDLAKRAFDEAVAEIDALDVNTYDDSTLILRLIRDNLTVWTEQNGTAQDRGQENDDDDEVDSDDDEDDEEEKDNEDDNEDGEEEKDNEDEVMLGMYPTGEEDSASVG